MNCIILALISYEQIHFMIDSYISIGKNSISWTNTPIRYTRNQTERVKTSNSSKSWIIHKRWICFIGRAPCHCHCNAMLCIALNAIAVKIFTSNQIFHYYSDHIVRNIDKKNEEIYFKIELKRLSIFIVSSFKFQVHFNKMYSLIL